MGVSAEAQTSAGQPKILNRLAAELPEMYATELYSPLPIYTPEKLRT